MFSVPLIGPMVTGPLGVCELPRMWQKGLLKTIGVLPSEYAFGDRGFDKYMMDGIGIDRDAFVAHLATLPTYLQTEAWVREHATSLAAKDAPNTFILERVMSAEGSQGVRDRAGIGDASFANGARLTSLDDLVALHAYVVAHRGKTLPPFAPAVSSLLAGPLGLLHLPRLWAKAMIKTIGALPEGYHSGSGPIDEQLAETIGMDLAASVAFTESTLPSYIAYETWVRENATNLTATAMDPWNQRIPVREKPEHIAAPERELLGIDDPAQRGSRLLNDLIDWHYVHEEIAAA